MIYSQSALFGRDKVAVPIRKTPVSLFKSFIGVIKLHMRDAEQGV